MAELQYLTKQQKHTVSEILITLVCDLPMLYDKKNKDYKQKDKCDKKWKELRESIRESTGIEIKKGKHIYSLLFVIDCFIYNYNFM